MRILYGDVIDIDGHILKARFSSDFDDLSHECVKTDHGHWTCWSDIDKLYSDEEECALYGHDWICYLQVRHTWQHGNCLVIDGQDVCDKDFMDVAKRECVTMRSGEMLCPSAYGKRTPRLEDLHQNLTSKQAEPQV